MTRAASVVAAVIAVLAAGCGSDSSTAPKIERTFDVHWQDRASQVAVTYTARHIVLHDGRWSAEVTVHNGSGKPLFEAPWTFPGDVGVYWNGPALVYSGLDVLQNRKLIFVPADKEVPTLPVPLANGATWNGTVSGKIPRTPKLPRASTIWLRYPVFGVGQAFDPGTPSDDVQWISSKGFTL